MSDSFQSTPQSLAQNSRWINGSMGGWVNGKMGEWVADRQMGEWMDEWASGLVGGWIHGMVGRWVGE